MLLSQDSQANRNIVGVELRNHEIEKMYGFFTYDKVTKIPMTMAQFVYYICKTV